MGYGKAQAKLILLGEHFVVPFTDAAGVTQTGSDALAIPIPMLQTEVWLKEDSRCAFDTAENAKNLMETAVRLASNRFHWDLSARPLRVNSGNNFPSSRGLGSSASFSVALCRAFSELTKSNFNLQAEVQQIENLFHGKSSGLDTATILSESGIVFSGGKTVNTFHLRAVDIVIADSGPRESSSSLVSRTQEIRKSRPAFWKSLADQVNELVRTTVVNIERPDGATDVAHAIRNSHEILDQIGLVNPQLTSLISLGKKVGAIAGKMSGAGNGGVVLFVTHPGEGTQTAEKLRGLGAKVVTTVLA